MSNWFNGPWWGKLIGAALGMAIKGPLGAVIGAFVGHQFDLGLADPRPEGGAEDWNTRRVAPRQFFYETFVVMGHVAKSDGRVSEHEIEAASAVMDAWNLNSEQTNLAIRFFNEGKDKRFDLYKVLQQFNVVAGNNRQLLHSFIACQMQIMLAQHPIHPSTRQRIWEICQFLNVSRVEMAQIEAQLRPHGQNEAVGSLTRAYKRLGVDESASDNDIKTAYRRMMNRYHPDKLIGDGLSSKDRDDARVALQQCRDAYEMIRTARGIR